MFIQNPTKAIVLNQIKHKRTSPQSLLTIHYNSILIIFLTFVRL